MKSSINDNSIQRDTSVDNLDQISNLKDITESIECSKLSKKYTRFFDTNTLQILEKESAISSGSSLEDNKYEKCKVQIKEKTPIHCDQMINRSLNKKKKSDEVCDELIRAQKDFFEIFKYLQKSKSRVEFVEWLHGRIEEAKQNGKIRVLLVSQDSMKSASKKFDRISSLICNDSDDRQICIKCDDMFNYRPKLSKNGPLIEKKDEITNSKLYKTKDTINFHMSNDSESDVIDEKLVIEENTENFAMNENKCTSVEQFESPKKKKFKIYNSTKSDVKLFKDTQCNECGKKFANYSTLKRHALLHTGIRFKCTGCDKTFSRQDYLKIHRNKCKNMNSSGLLSSIDSSLITNKNEELYDEIKEEVL